VIINGHFAFFCLKNGKTAGKRLPKARQSDNINLYMQKNCRENRRFSMKKQRGTPAEAEASAGVFFVRRKNGTDRAAKTENSSGAHIRTQIRRQ